MSADISLYQIRLKSNHII